MVQLAHPYMTTGKTVALTIWTFAGKVASRGWAPLSAAVISSPLMGLFYHQVSADTVSFGRTDAEAEAPIIWPPDVKN